MSQLPITPLSPEDQQRLMGQLYALLAKQVQSYHKHHHMGENSSVPVELAQELMASMEYTIESAGGLAANRDAKLALKAGQAILEEKVKSARQQLDLVYATAPGWQTECRWEALQALRGYLAAYDPLHLAHRGPDALYYPLPIPIPDGLQAIDLARFYIQILWFENQIMAAFPDDVLNTLWDRLPADTLNQCEQVILNALGKALLGAEGLVFTEEEIVQLERILDANPICEAIAKAAYTLEKTRSLSPSAAEYLKAAAQQLSPRIEGAKVHIVLSNVFI